MKCCGVGVNLKAVEKSFSKQNNKEDIIFIFLRIYEEIHL